MHIKPVDSHGSTTTTFHWLAGFGRGRRLFDKSGLLYSKRSVHFSLMTIEAIYWVKMTLLGTGEAVQGYEKHLQVTPLEKKYDST